MLAILKVDYLTSIIHLGMWYGKYWLLEYRLCTQKLQDIYFWIDNSTISIFHLDIIWTSKPYYIQKQNHTCRIQDHYIVFETYKRCNSNNDSNWKCHVLSDVAQHEYKLCHSILYVPQFIHLLCQIHKKCHVLFKIGLTKPFNLQLLSHPLVEWWMSQKVYLIQLIFIEEA